MRRVLFGLVMGGFALFQLGSFAITGRINVRGGGWETFAESPFGVSAIVIACTVVLLFVGGMFWVARKDRNTFLYSKPVPISDPDHEIVLKTNEASSRPRNAKIDQ